MRIPAPRSQRLLLSRAMFSSAPFHAHNIACQHSLSNPQQFRLFCHVPSRFATSSARIFCDSTKIPALFPLNDVSLPVKNLLAESLLVSSDCNTTFRRCLSHDSSLSSDDRPALSTTTEVQEGDDAVSLLPSISGAGGCDEASARLEARKAEKNSVAKRMAASRSQSERKRGLFSRHAQEGIPDLLTVPGIGPRNMEKLVAKGIGKVSELKQLYLDKFVGDGTDKMVEFLQSSVGILHKHHAMSITAYIKDSIEKETKSEDSMISDSAMKQRNRLTFCVEGNISVGKTTFLQRVTNEAIELRDLVEIVPEPVAKWQDVGPEHFNILDAFYAEPQRYAYTFQNYVFVTRLMQEQESARGLKPLRLMERSVFSDRMVFVRAVHEAKWMNEMEISIYDSWFSPVVSVLPGLVPDGFIYLRASPDTCHERLQRRKRPEEQGVTLDYLRGLHEKHEQWLFPAKSSVKGHLSITQWPSQLIEPLPPRIRDRVFYLEGDHVHSSIQKVPALILDCEANIDFTKDFEAKADYAGQVAEFFEYVKRTKLVESEVETAQDVSRSSLILPRPSVLRPYICTP